MNTKNIALFLAMLLASLGLMLKTQAMTFSSFSPGDNATNVDGDSNLQVTFTVNACSNNLGSFTVKRSSDNSTIESISYLSSQISGTNSPTITVDTYITLKKNTDYYINMSSSMYRNCSNSMDWSSAINDTSTWNFSVGSSGSCTDTFNEPCFTPADNATAVSLFSNLVLEFNRSVEAYNQYSVLKIYKYSDNSLVETVNLYNGANVSFNGRTITINPNTRFDPGTHYYITLNGGLSLVATTNNSLIYTINGNDNSTWDFTTDYCGYGPICCGVTCNGIFVRDPVFTPLTSATGISVTSNLIMLFNAELMHINEPNTYIRIKKTSNNSTVETIATNSPKITIENGNFMGDASLDTRITVNPDTVLDGNTSYYIDISCGAFANPEGEGFWLNTSFPTNIEQYPGIFIQVTSLWSFTTGAGGSDTTPPGVSSFTPADNATGISVLTNLSILFDEAVDLQSGNLVIKRSSNNATIETVSISSGQVTGNGTTTIAVNPSVTLLNGTAYYVQIDATAIDDLAANSYAGISDTTTWNFTTSGTADSTAPTVLYYSPANTAAMVARYQGLNLVFSEAVFKGSGNIYVKRYSDDVTIYTVDVSSSTVVINGTSLTIKGPSLLNAGFRFYVEFPSGVILDSYGNAFTGISNKDTWNFNTTQDNSLYNSY